MLISTVNAGWIEAIVGCMGSGKTEELARRVRRLQLAGRKVAVFGYRFAADDNDGFAVPDAELQFPGSTMRVQGVSSSADIAQVGPSIEVIALDDAQFFDAGLPEVLRHLANDGHQVIVAGLDLDFLGQGFGSMPEILAQAEDVTNVLQSIALKNG